MDDGEHGECADEGGEQACHPCEDACADQNGELEVVRLTVGWVFARTCLKEGAADGFGAKGKPKSADKDPHKKDDGREVEVLTRVTAELHEP